MSSDSYTHVDVVTCNDIASTSSCPETNVLGLFATLINNGLNVNKYVLWNAMHFIHQK